MLHFLIEDIDGEVESVGVTPMGGGVFVLSQLPEGEQLAQQIVLTEGQVLELAVKLAELQGAKLLERPAKPSMIRHLFLC